MKTQHYHPTLELRHSHDGSTVFNMNGNLAHDHYMLETVYDHDFDGEDNCPPKHLKDSESNRGYGDSPASSN